MFPTDGMYVCVRAVVHVLSCVCAYACKLCIMLCMCSCVCELYVSCGAL